MLLKKRHQAAILAPLQDLVRKGRDLRPDFPAYAGVEHRAAGARPATITGGPPPATIASGRGSDEERTRALTGLRPRQAEGRSPLFPNRIHHHHHGRHVGVFLGDPVDALCPAATAVEDRLVGARNAWIVWRSVATLQADDVEAAQFGALPSAMTERNDVGIDARQPADEGVNRCGNAAGPRSSR
jgi:hypothetical protein